MFEISILLVAIPVLSLLTVLIRMFRKEGEIRASKKAGLLLLLCIVAFASVWVSHLEITWYITLGLAFILLLLLFFPVMPGKHLPSAHPTSRFDERDIMFSRKELIPGSPLFNEYYRRRPELEGSDMEFRALPGLLSQGSMYFHEKAFAAAKQSFRELDQLKPRITGLVTALKKPVPPADASRILKNIAFEAGALDAGITFCKPYHFYSHKGRGDEYGKEIPLTHRYALAFTVEMDHRMVASAPKASIVMESARQYLRSGQIAVMIAERIREMGYDARAHIDGNYQLICPLVARDAGLGEIGRMGLLMTPDHGPRVRIAVITTEMELAVDEKIDHSSMIDFCMLCRKCADCCPSHSIPEGPQTEIEGVFRWKIDSDSCFNFWCRAGTDCGRCMAVCPYSHPAHSLHKVARWGLKRSKPFRFLAVKMDDFFYGRNPLSRPLPEYLNKN